MVDAGLKSSKAKKTSILRCVWTTLTAVRHHIVTTDDVLGATGQVSPTKAACSVARAARISGEAFDR